MRISRRFASAARCSFILAGLFLCLFPLSEEVRAEAAPIPVATLVFTDPLLPDASRSIGAAMDGTGLKDGSVKWAATGGITIGALGATATSPGGAHHAIHPTAGIVLLQADIDPRGSGFTGLCLGRGDLSGNFWANLAVVYYVTGSSYNVVAGSESLIKGADPALLKTSGTNHLELRIDTVARTITARLNDRTVLDAVALPATVRTSDLTAAGFRFNEPVTAGQPVLSHYRLEVTSTASTGLEPVDLAAFVTDPDKTATLVWKVGSPGPQKEVPYIVSNYDGSSMEHGSAILSPERTLTLTRSFPRGYSEIQFPESGQTFGVISMEPHQGPADPFFCMDGALSWLEKDPGKRAALVKVAARSGIAMMRERLGLGGINPEKGIYHWEGGDHHDFDTLRKIYADNHLPILEILEGGGGHIGHVCEAGYAQNHAELAATVADVAKHWPVWGGAEVDNEPDLKPFPAEQYVPSVKSMSYALQQAHSDTPLVTGVFATIPPGPYFDACGENGMLDDSDVVSFHSYDRAPSIEAMVARYRAWLESAGKPALPLWHTECGWSWSKGPARPPQQQDALSAMEISAKGVETLACGVARYFPFVYVFYEEGQKNFGMLGEEGTPLRSMAAYAASIQALSGKKYLGDLSGVDPAVGLARVFGSEGSAEVVVVLYTGKIERNANIAFPVKTARVTGADGRSLDAMEGRVPIPDGLAYVWTDASALQGHLKTDTTAMRLYRTGLHPLAQKRLASPLVLQFLASGLPARSSARRYLVTREVARTFPLKVRVHNLSGEPVVFTPELSLPGKKAERSAPVTVPAMGSVDIAWTPNLSAVLDIASTRFIFVSGQAAGGIQPSPLAIPVVMDGTMEEHLQRHKNQEPLPIADSNRWQQNIASGGKSTFSATAGGGVLAEFNFTGGGGGWTYPKFKLPAPIDPARYSGLLIRARIAKAANTVAIIAEPDDSSPSFWISDLFPADGEWHVVYIPFAEFKPGPNGTGNQNTRLNPASWKELCIGMGSSTPENSIEVSQLILVGGDGE